MVGTSQVKYHRYTVVLRSIIEISVKCKLSNICLEVGNSDTAKQAAILMMAQPSLWMCEKVEYEGFI